MKPIQVKIDDQIIDCRLNIVKLNPLTQLLINKEYLYLVKYNDTIGVGVSVEDATEHFILVMQKQKELDIRFKEEYPS